LKSSASSRAVAYINLLQDFGKVYHENPIKPNQIFGMQL